MVESAFVRIRSPRSRDAVEQKYRHARLSVTSDSHVRYKLYDTEDEWNEAAEAQGDSRPSVDELEKDHPLAIRYCTMVSKDKSRSVLVQAPNAGYTGADKDFIDPLLVIRKIKFESHDKAVSWSNTLNQHNGDDHGHHHVDTALLENKIMMHAVSSFASQEMGATKTIPPASPSKAVISSLVLSHVYKLCIIPDIQQMNIPVINKPMPDFIKQRSFKRLSGTVGPMVEAQMAKAFHLVEQAVVKLAEVIQRFIDKLVEWCIVHIIRPIIHRVRGPQPEPREEKTSDNQPTVRERVMTKAKELSSKIPFSEILSQLKTLLIQVGINLNVSSMIGFNEQHYRAIASDELMNLVGQMERSI